MQRFYAGKDRNRFYLFGESVFVEFFNFLSSYGFPPVNADLFCDGGASLCTGGSEGAGTLA